MPKVINLSASLTKFGCKVKLKKNNLDWSSSLLLSTPVRVAFEQTLGTQGLTASVVTHPCATHGPHFCAVTDGHL